LQFNQNNEIALPGSIRANFVVDTKQKAKLPNAQPGGHDAYETPKLKVYGPVGALTQGGSLGNVEMGMSMSGMMQRP